MRRFRTRAVAALLLAATGCRVGPNYERPAVALSGGWIERDHAALNAETSSAATWWNVFDDPVLDRLVATAYAENLTLRAAGLRVLAAQARRSIALGNLFPQDQAVTGGYTRTHQSANTQFGTLGGRDFDTFQLGFDAAWEIDLWGKFRRALEAADADVLAAVASYDDVLVSLVSEVAATYVRIRVLDERLAVARDNVRVQDDGLRIARVRFEAGGTSQLDVEQATALLRDTEATIPDLERQRREATDSLCVLLGMPPRDVDDVLAGTSRVPRVPASVAVGIPRDLLRRRPDVRAAEEAAAAQSARIGVAAADLLPAFTLSGSIGLTAEDAAKFFEGRSLEAVGGPSVRWPVLNYGRLVNNVRLQDATFQELAVRYENTVLVAQQEVEDALAGYLRGAEQADRLAQSVAAANRAVELSTIQYREGATDYTAVLNTQQAKLRANDTEVSARGGVTLSVIALYKAVGGGWELRDDDDFVPAETRAAMRARTAWGGVLPARAPAADGEHRRPWWYLW